MEREQAAKRQRLEREAAEAKKAAGRQDAPWLQERIVVKACPYLSDYASHT